MGEKKHLCGIILEFKVHDPEDEKTLRDTVQAALEQIDEKQYASILIEKGVKNIRKYCFAFEGKTVLSDRTVMTRGTKID